MGSHGCMKHTLKSLPTLTTKGKMGEGPGHACQVPTPMSGRAPLFPGRLGAHQDSQLVQGAQGLGPLACSFGCLVQGTACATVHTAL